MALDNNYPAPASEHVATDRSNQRKGVFASPHMAGGANFFSVADFQRSYRSPKVAINAVAGNTVSAVQALGANHVALSVRFSVATDTCSIILRKSSDNSIFKQWDGVTQNSELYASAHENIELGGADLKVEIANKVGAGTTTVNIVALS